MLSEEVDLREDCASKSMEILVEFRISEGSEGDFEFTAQMTNLR